MVRTQVVFLPKAGNSLAEYEDAYASNKEALRFAVADGASESSFASNWASLLTRAHAQFGVSDLGFDYTVSVLRRVWRKNLNLDGLPWYAQEKAAQGAFATFLGFSLFPQGYRWYAIAVGDTCLFQIRDDALKIAFPIQHCEEFGSVVYLLGSNPTYGKGKSPQIWRGDYHPQDVFILATDAVSQWFLRETATGEKPWRTLLALEENGAQEVFRKWVDTQRLEGRMRNDDVTVMLIRDCSRG